MVAVQVVRQEPDAALQGHEPGAPGQVFQFGGGQTALGPLQETPGVDLVQPDVEIDLAQILFILLAVVGAEADGVAEVVDGKARHGGVQINDADTLVGSAVDEDVVELGVIVGNPQRELAAAQRFQCHGAVGLPIQYELDIGGDVLGPAQLVGSQRGLKFGKPILGVVEVHNRFVQGSGGIALQQVLEPAEGPGGGLEQLRGGGLEAVRIFNEGGQPPDLPVRVGVEVLPFFGLHQRQGLPQGVATGEDYLFP